MRMQRDAERLVLHGVGGGRPRRFLASARAAVRFCPSAVIGGSLPVGRIDDQRRAQVQRHAALAAVQPELREVVVHVGDRARLGLLAFDRGGAS